MRLVTAERLFSGSILVCGVAMAMLVTGPWVTAAYASSVDPTPFLMADDTGGNQGGGGGGSGQGSGQQIQGQPLPGQLIVPGSPQQGQGDNSKKGKQCMTTCAQWGEECMLVNQGAGGMQRRCRHVCKKFTEECF